ncbi:MAG: hypothetical protein AB7S44_03760 [Spirochaetales bacterium]
MIYDEDEKIATIVNYGRANVLMSFYSYAKKTLNGIAKGFSGVKTILFLKCKEHQKFNVQFTTIRGKAKLVAVSKDNKVTVLAENIFVGDINTKFEKGRYKIRLVGEAADVTFKLKKITKK